MQKALFDLDSTMPPLAEKMRPKTFEEFVGQEHLVGPGKFITETLRAPVIPSLILWGPPGSGKTTLAHLLGNQKNHRFMFLSAVTSGIKEVKEIITQAEEELRMFGKKTLLFIDEIHRFNKAQQDAFLPFIEKGIIILIGATTENPSFEIIPPLLSRCKVLVLKKLDKEDLEKIVKRALENSFFIEQDALKVVLESCDGDARRMLNTLETAVSFTNKTIRLSHIETALQKKALVYDKSGEEHYNLISAFIKSMRDSDPDAAIYYLARMLEAGEEPLFLARRMVIFASEDVGNADPQAVQVAVSCMQSFDFVGMPEGWIPLAQCATYLASAPKSNSSYLAYLKAKEDVEKYGALPTPLHLRNAPTALMKNLGYGKEYLYAHDHKDHIVIQEHLPEKIRDKKYYIPSENGYERRISEWLTQVQNKKK